MTRGVGLQIQKGHLAEGVHRCSKGALEQETCMDHKASLYCTSMPMLTSIAKTELLHFFMDILCKMDAHDQMLDRSQRRAYVHGFVAGSLAFVVSSGIVYVSKLRTSHRIIAVVASTLVASNFMTHYSFLIARERILFDKRLESAMRTESRKS
ncbi:hypothetical protein EDD86DRAFT_198873 [Gorgonomyces haynaldii]|nr:hypothetical protein EDD86DRAFT_198873 [Gorgonomyces haynaldii]